MICVLLCAVSETLGSEVERRDMSVPEDVPVHLVRGLETTTPHPAHQDQIPQNLQSFKRYPQGRKER